MSSFIPASDLTVAPFKALKNAFNSVHSVCRDPDAIVADLHRSVQPLILLTQISPFSRLKTWTGRLSRRQKVSLTRIDSVNGGLTSTQWHYLYLRAKGRCFTNELPSFHLSFSSKAMGISTLLSFIGINLSVAVLDINNVIAHGRFSVFGNFGTHLCLKLFINFRRDKDIGEE